MAEEAEYVLIRESRDAFAVVVGTRGRGAFADALLGSFSPAVATHTHCPGVVVRGEGDARVAGGRHARVVVGGVAGAPASPVRFAYEEARRRRVPPEAVRA